jgi:hypothetical protein
MPEISAEAARAEIARLSRIAGVSGIAPAGVASHKICPVCGHKGFPTPDETCPNNNCPRHGDAAIVGIHPSKGHAIYDAEELAAAQAEHVAVFGKP